MASRILTRLMNTSKMSLPASFPLKVKGGKTIEIPAVGFGTWAAGSSLPIIFSDVQIKYED